MPAARATPRRTSTATSKHGTSRCCRRWLKSSASSSNPMSAAPPNRSIRFGDRQATGQSADRRGGRAADARAGKSRAAECRDVGPQHRAIEVSLPDGVGYRAGDHLSIVPQNGAALVERAIRRSARARRARDAGGGRRQARGAAGRRSHFGSSPAVDFVELQLPATRKQIQTMAQHTRCPSRARTRAAPGRGAISVGDPGQAHVGARPSGAAPACELPFAAFLEMLPLMTPRYYSISSSRSPTVHAARSPPPWSRARRARLRESMGSLHQPSGAPGARRHAAGLRQGDQGGLPPAGRSAGADRHDRAGHRLAPSAASCASAPRSRRRAAAWDRRCCSSAVAIPSRTSSMPMNSRNTPEAGIVDLHVAFSRHDGKKTYVQDLLKDRPTACAP